MPVEQAVQALDNSWTMNHDACILAWNQQVADDAAVAQQQVPQQLMLEDPVPQAQPTPEVDEDDAEKKKPKMKDFDNATTVGNYIAPRPAQYALRCIEEFEYVELWYFTLEGCSDATQLQLAQHNDTF